MQKYMYIHHILILHNIDLHIHNFPFKLLVSMNNLLPEFSKKHKIWSEFCPGCPGWQFIGIGYPRHNCVAIPRDGCLVKI